MDVYPDVIVAHGALPAHGSVTGLLGSVFRRAYRGACRIVALGPVMAQSPEPGAVIEPGLTCVLTLGREEAQR